jgi:cell wall-associated NlpC family hydrolase
VVLSADNKRVGEKIDSAMPTRRSSGRVWTGFTHSGRLIRGVASWLALLLVTAGMSAIPALASPESDYANAAAQAAKLQVQIAVNSQRADILDEQYQQAQRAVAAADQKITATKRQISVIEARAHRLRDLLGSRAAMLYIGAGNSDPIGVDATSFQQLGSMTQYANAAAAQDERLLDELSRTDAELNTQHDNLEGALATAQDQKRTAQNSRREVARVNASMQTLLDSTSANVRMLVTQIEQQALAAAAVAERAWLQRLAAQQEAARRKHAQGGDATSPAPGDDGAAPGDLPAPTVGAFAAVAYAQAQLGKPYVYAAAGPDAFDCSGLTMMAWAQGGVLMEHGSQAQYDSFPHVAILQLQPGDLVFFGTSGPTNHHVGIVVGPGIMIDAPHTGAYVELVSYYRSDLVLMGARP